MDQKSKIYLIAGPTASGKSSFSIKLAKKVNGEIINADSMQVYKELKILTARPSLKSQKKIKHHLYGFLNVKKKFSVGDWINLAKKKISSIQSNKKTPIIVGGTGMYFNSLIEGLVEIPLISKKSRVETIKLQRKLGQSKFYKKLIRLDPKIKGKFNSQDIQRSIRAYEVKKYTKRSLIDWFGKTRKIFNDKEFIKIYIDYPRSELIKKIEARTKEMIENGAINEVKKFLKLKIKKENSSSKVIGISEISQYIRGKMSIEDLKEKISIKTRQYAKRQTTWSRSRMVNWQKIHPKHLNTFIKNI